MMLIWDVINKRTTSVLIFCLLLISIGCSQNPAGMALKLDGSNDCMTTGICPPLQITGDVTVEAWVYINGYPDPASTFPFAEIVQQAGWDNYEQNNELYTLAITGDGLIDCFHENGEGVNNTLFSKNAVPIGKWVHLANVRDTAAQTYRIYINGVLDTTGTYKNNPTGGSNTAFIVGSNFDGLDFNGMIDEVRIWNRVRSQHQIMTTMNKSLESEYTQSADSGLVGYWRFDRLYNFGIGNDGRVDDVRDLSVYQNHGDLFDNASLYPSNAFAHIEGN